MNHSRWITSLACLAIALSARSALAQTNDDVHQPETVDTANAAADNGTARTVIPAPFNPRPNTPEFLTASIRNGQLIVNVHVTQKHEGRMISPTTSYEYVPQSYNVTFDGRIETRERKVEVVRTQSHSRLFT